MPGNPRHAAKCFAKLLSARISGTTLLRYTIALE
jgi:hypothetical protein